jgi:hypothetical protein
VHCGRRVQFASLHFWFVALMVVDLEESGSEKSLSVVLSQRSRDSRRRCLYRHMMDHFPCRNLWDMLVTLGLSRGMPYYGSLSLSQNLLVIAFSLRRGFEVVSWAVVSLGLSMEPEMFSHC